MKLQLSPNLNWNTQHWYKVAVSNAFAGEPNDPGYKRLTFRGLDNKVNPADHIDAIERFMKQHFPRVKLVTVENHYKNNFRNKVHTLYKTAFVEVTLPVVSEQVFEIINSNQYDSHKFTFNGKAINVSRGVFQVAITRHKMLKAAKRALKNNQRNQ